MTARPTTIEGGCLCGGVRYKVDFAADHDWKKAVRPLLHQHLIFITNNPRKPSTCQCTQCRKNSGALVYYLHAVQASELTWLSKSTLGEYQSSAGCLRGFCNNCGSPLFWRKDQKDAEVELAVGTFDEEYLLGGRDSEDKPTGAYAIALANPDGHHSHLRNEIKGITDHVAVSGTKYWKTSSEGPPMSTTIF